MKHPESILSINDSICNGEYDAYVYKYTNTTNGKWYVGYHPGQFDGSYWHSSENKEFIKVFSGSEPVLTIDILSTGLLKDMRNLESKILTEQKVKKNPLSYNGAGSPTGNKEIIDIEKDLEIAKIIENRYGEYQTEDFDPVNKLPKLQPRTKENLQHIGRIRDGMRETGLKKQTPVLIWEGSHPKTNEDMVGNGIHTLKSIDGLLNINQVKTIRISREEILEWGLDIVNMRYIGNLLNPRAEVPKLENDEDDAIKQLLGLKEKGVAISENTDYGHRILKGLGFKRTANIIKKAEAQYKANIRSKSGLKIAQYTKDNKENFKALERKAEGLRNGHSIVIKMGTSHPSKILRAILESILDEKAYPKHYDVHLVYYHGGTNDTNKEKWDNGEHASIKKLVRDMLKAMGPKKFKDDNGNMVKMERSFQTHEMPHLQSDISL